MLPRILFCVVSLGFWLPAVADDRLDRAELEAVFEAAKQRLPGPLRDRLGNVKLIREEELGMGQDAPLEYRLLGRAAFASFRTATRELAVYDAGMSRRPTWKGGKVSRADLARFFAGLADLLKVKPPGNAIDPAVDLAWAEFVKRVWSWGGDPVPHPIPEVGDEAVFTRFLQDGVWRAMGGEASLEQLIVHEFGHALQLETDSMRERMRYWGFLSGTVNRDDASPSDGFAGVSFGMENMMVLIRLLLEDEPGKVVRGEEALYQSSPKANFVNRYARYDLREDYAECFRLMTDEPESLIKVAPEKFLYLNALGWNARLDRANPGPLWYSGDELERLLPRSMRKALFRKIFGVEGSGPAWHPLPLVAVLRAHRDELSATDLPAPHEVVELPNDLPRELREALSPDLLTVEIEGRKYLPSEAHQRQRQDEIIVKWMEIYEYDLIMAKYRLNGSQGVVGAYQKDVVGLNNGGKRSARFEVLREMASDQVDQARWREWHLAETWYHKKAGNVWLAARYAILASEVGADKKLAQISELGSKSDAGFERALFMATAVDVALETGDPKKVRTAIEAIPGETFGAWLRLRASLRAAKIFGDEGFLVAARKESQDIELPLLGKYLKGLLD